MKRGCYYDGLWTTANWDCRLPKVTHNRVRKDRWQVEHYYELCQGQVSAERISALSPGISCCPIWFWAPGVGRGLFEWDVRHARHRVSLSPCLSWAKPTIPSLHFWFAQSTSKPAYVSTSLTWSATSPWPWFWAHSGSTTTGCSSGMRRSASWTTSSPAAWCNFGMRRSCS